MYNIIAFVSLVFLTGCLGFGDVKQKPAGDTRAGSSFYDLEAQSIDGKTIHFEQYRGKKVLIVNTASKCGFTPQFEALQRFYETYKDSVVVLGFPSNEFAGQDPGSNEEIAGFCRKNYGVTFTMFEKTEVKSDRKHPVYQWLTEPALNGWNDKAPSWNFGKYLINAEGQLIGYYASAVEPFSSEIAKDLSK